MREVSYFNLGQFSIKKTHTPKHREIKIVSPSPLNDRSINYLKGLDPPAKYGSSMP